MLFEALHCEVDGIDVAVSVSEIEQIGDYAISPFPPVTEEWASGIATQAGKMFLTVALSNKKKGTGSKGLLIKSQSGGVRWALQVDQINYLVNVEVLGEDPYPVPGWKIPKQWVLKASDATGKKFGWVDTSVIFRCLRGTAI